MMYLIFYYRNVLYVFYVSHVFMITIKWFKFYSIQFNGIYIRDVILNVVHIIYMISILQCIFLKSLTFYLEKQLISILFLILARKKLIIKFINETDKSNDNKSLINRNLYMN